MQRNNTAIPLAEPEWAIAMRRNDADALQRLYAEHLPSVRQYVLNNQGSATDAEDVFQEAMMVLWLWVKEGRFQFATDGDPGGFLFRVAKNKWLDVLRSAAHRNMKVVQDDRLPENGVEAVDDVEGRLQRLRDIYDQLDDRCRSVLDRFYFERKDMATIAEELGVGEDSIRTMKYRCMMKLRAFRRTIASRQDNGRP